MNYIVLPLNLNFKIVKYEIDLNLKHNWHTYIS